MRMGTDISIQECRAEGYMVMDYKVRELFPNGKKQPIDREYPAQFTKSLPEYCRVGYVGEPIIHLDEEYSWNDLWELYLQHKMGVDSFAGHEFDDANPQPFDLLCLADILDAYCGINTQ